MKSALLRIRSAPLASRPALLTSCPAHNASRSALIASLVAAPGCVGSGAQDVLNPGGPQAAAIAEWFWVSVALAAVVYVAYLGILTFGLVRAARRRRRRVPNELPERHGWHMVVWGGVVVPAAILLGLIVYSTVTDRRITALGGGSAGDVLEIQVVGHQFWWEVRYRDHRNPYREFTTANEVHIPAGRPVRILLESRDVIHSFWVPNLHGKTDMIPGHTTSQVLQADRPGVYRGQCAEFCGAQHALMAMVVIALEPDAFRRWWDRQLVPHVTPTDPELAFGHAVFLRSGCGVCHAVRGTPARGTVAPDLSYFGDRRTIGAGVVPNTPGHLSGWIADPQGIKPGNRMPPMPLDGDELRAVMSYLLSLR